jgi:hypothetical protein
MDIPKEEVKGLKFEHSNQDFYPENLQNSKLLPYINEHLQFKISDFSLVYHKSEEESINMLKMYNFLTISDDTAIYEEQQINCVFICDESILNDNLLNEIKNINDVSYSRIYKKNNYKWIFVPKLEKKDNFIQFIKDKNIKMFNLKKSSIINSIIYYKESYDLKDRRKNSDFSNSSNNKWRKYSKNGYIPHKASYNSNYYNNNYHRGYKGRERFNSDGNNSKSNNSYYYNNNHTNNNYNKSGQIEVEIGEIKYPLSIKYKYSNNFLNNIFLKFKNENYFDTKPNYLVEDNEIISNKPKNIEIIKFTSSPTKDIKDQAFENRNIDGENKSNLKIKIPKTNPLSQIRKAYNKFDGFPQNIIVTK